MSRIIPFALLGLLLAGQVDALPTLYGPGGLVVLPEAATTPGWALAATAADDPGRTEVSARGTYGASWGEVGALVLSDDVDALGVNGKLRLVSIPGSAVVLGALLLESDVTDTEAIYLAGTTTVHWLRLTGGVTWTRIATEVGSASATRPYVGLRFTLPDGMALVAEYQTKSGRLYEPRPLSSVMIERSYGSFRTMIGMTNAAGLLGRDDHHLFSGLAYMLGGSSQ
jgi:hypothetical protein